MCVHRRRREHDIKLKPRVLIKRNARARTQTLYNVYIPVWPVCIGYYIVLIC